MSEAAEVVLFQDHERLFRPEERAWAKHTLASGGDLRSGSQADEDGLGVVRGFGVGVLAGGAAHDAAEGFGEGAFGFVA